ncbi:hypothetical protein JCM3774_001133 [Rhodotorula dairenensis]
MQSQGHQPRSASHGRHRSTSGGGGASGAYQPPTDTSPDLYDFVNAFWTDGQSSRNNRGRDPDDIELDWGRNGYETVMGRVKAGNKVCEDLRALLKERASAADDYAKRLNKLSKHHFGTGETGHMERAMLQLKSELESSSKSQQDFAQLLRTQEGMLGDFSNKRDSARKTQQASVEKLWKSVVNQRQHVLKAKAKYQDDAIQINALHAQASLLQGRDLDKATLKLDKAQQTVMVNERDYRNYVNVLKETTVNWNMAWKSFCDLVQDQEEERLEFVKSRMWDYANGISTLAMNEDESAERTRTALEQVDPKTDVRIFVQQYGTGNAIPDPIPFVDVAAKEPPPKQTYKLARFTRSSTRIPGVKHSPSAIGDIAKAMGQTPAPIRQQSLPPSEPPRSHSQPEPSTPIEAARPSSRAANRSSMPAYDEQVPRAGTSPTKVTAEASRPSPHAHGEEGSFTPARFPVSPSANARARPTADSISPASPNARPGHVTAGAFQNRQVSPSMGSTAAVGTSPGAPAPSGRYGDLSHGASGVGSAPKPNNEDDDENDPLVKALRVLQSTPVQASPRARSSVDLRNSAVSPTQPQTRAQGHGAQHSFGSSRSRPASPEKTSMQVPAQAQPRARSPSIPQQQQARPASRAGSAVAANSPAARPNPNSASSAHLTSPPPAGQYSTRPASPSRGPGQPTSPQPFIPPSLRPSSPAVGANPARSSSPAARSPGGGGPPASGYGITSGQQIAYASPPPPVQTGGYAALPHQQPQHSPYGQPGTAPAPMQAQQPAPAPYRAVSPAPRPTSIAAPPVGYAPPPTMQPQPQQYLSQAPSQHFQPAPSPQQQAPPPQTVYQSPAPASYGYPAAQPQYQQQPAYGRPPSVVGGYPSPAQHAAVARTPSMHSGVSGVSAAQQTPQQAYQVQQQPPPQFQHPPAQYQPPQQTPVQQLSQPPPQSQMPRAQSVASLRAGQAAPPPPTGQYTETGQPILFYVNALFDYAATSAEEFSFSTGDVIAVTGTDPDGWWQGNRVGDSGPSKLFPSNFTELLP